LHCNGGHYYRAPSRCPRSGYGHPRASDIIALAAGRRAATYQALLDAGMEEAMIMHTLVLPIDMACPDPWVCAFPAPPDLVELVVARNAWLLERFPSGALAAALVPRPQIERTYCELPGRGWWYLVDPRSSAQWPSSMSRELEDAVTGCSSPGARFLSLVVDAEFPPLMIDPRCWARPTIDHPLIPAAHLQLE
jgi:hypothetical protein